MSIYEDKNNQHNGQFHTTDIKLSAYLMSCDVKLLDIRVTDGLARHSTYYLEQPPDELLTAWLGGNPQANAKRVIDNYRHLLADSRRIAREGR